jgi:hypothetical protein
VDATMNKFYKLQANPIPKVNVEITNFPTYDKNGNQTGYAQAKGTYIKGFENGQLYHQFVGNNIRTPRAANMADLELLIGQQLKPNK